MTLRARQARHTSVLILVWAHAVIVPIYGLILGLGLRHSIMDGFPIVVAGAAASTRRLPFRVRALSATLALVSASAALVHLSGGYIELHFHFFVMVAVVSLYQDWIVFLGCIGFVAIHHGVGGVISPTDVYNHPDAVAYPLKWAAIHAGFVLFASAVAVVGWRLNEKAQGEAHRSERRYRAIAESAPDAILTVDAAGCIISWNDGASRLFGYEADEIIGQQGSVLAPEGAADAELADFASATGDLGARTFDLTVLTKSGREVPVELALSSWTVDGERFFSAIIRDISDRMAAEAALRRETAAVRLLTDVAIAANEAETVTDALQRSLTLLVESTGWSLGLAHLVDAEGESLVPTGLFHSVDDARFAAFVAATREITFEPGVGLPGRALVSGSPAWIAEIRSHGNAPRRDVARAAGLRSAAAFPVMVGGQVAAVLEFFATEARPEDPELLELMVNVGTQVGRVIERDRAETLLATQAMTDPLTGLPNRAVFLDRLGLAVARLERRSHTVAVLFVDLDRFKIVNDSMGHEAGDLLIQAVATRLRAMLRPSDTVARFGGDEFTVLCDELRGTDQVTTMAQRLLETLAEPFQIEGQEIFVTASVGIAVAEDASVRPEALLRDADAAMARAKDSGRAGWRLFDDGMRTAALRQLEVANALPRAIDRGELRVVYQPQVRLDDNLIVGFEALVRWQHPERGLIPPIDFVPVAEDTGLIVPLGNWVLRQACHQAAGWQERYGVTVPLKMSVNLSPKQLRHPGLVGDVASALADSGLDPACLVLELTESCLLDDGDTTLDRLAGLKALGVRLSIDDFGTGYSSLSYLQRFPVDEIKIDRSFIKDLDDKERLAVVRAIVRLSQTLGLETVAEGVEFGEHLGALRALHCDLAQGFLFARPLPPKETEALLAMSPTLLPAPASDAPSDISSVSEPTTH